MGDRLADLIVALYQRVRLGIRVAVSGRVDSFSASDSTATVTPSVADQDMLDGAPRTLPVPAVPGVPVMQYGGAMRGFTVGLSTGDDVVLVVRHRSHDEVDGGTAALPTDPSASRRMDYADAVALTGYQPPGTPRASWQYREDGQLVCYMVPGEAIHYGSSTAPLLLTRDDLLQAQLNTLKSAIAAAPVLAGDGGASFKAALLAALSAWPAVTASTRAKVDS